MVESMGRRAGRSVICRNLGLPNGDGGRVEGRNGRMHGCRLMKFL